MDERCWVGKVLEKENGFLNMLLANETIANKKSLDNQHEYECCTFKNCDFSDGYLTSMRFIECEFIDCNLSNIHVDESSFSDAVFTNCKMLGIHFDRCNTLLFSAKFEGCQLEHSTFYQMKLLQSEFNGCKLEGVDFTEADLKGTKVIACDLLNAKFEHTNLEGTNFLRSYGYSIDPSFNKISKAKFSLSQLPGLLSVHQLKIDRDS